MPFFERTPESLIHRSDSKNPATTCRGITLNGRACRRSLASSSQNSPSPSPPTNVRRNGVLAVIPNAGINNEGAAAFFCWQHQEQAETLANGRENGRTELFELEDRTSIDTLIDRLGVLEVQDQDKGKNKKLDTSHNGRPVRRETLPKQWQNVPGPLMTVPEDVFTTNGGSLDTPRPADYRTRKPKSPSTLNFSFFCCGSTPDADPPLAPQPRPTNPTDVTQEPRVSSGPASQIPKRRQPSIVSQDTAPQTPTRPPIRPQNHLVSSSSTSQTPILLSLIPTTLPPTTTSLLLAELAKPLPPTSLPGYIYIYWLTPSTMPVPSAQAASSLLSASSDLRDRRNSESSSVIYKPTTDGDGSTSGDDDQGKETIMLKIGRTSNVQRRLNEWTRQCEYNLSLIRYYPYHPSSPSQSSSPFPSPLPSPHQSPHRPSLSPHPSLPSPSPHLSPSSNHTASAPRKVPHVRRVERLIQIELAEQRVRRLCSGCFKEHREWFEVEGSREGVKGVDEVVRRWIGWAEGL